MKIASVDHAYYIDNSREIIKATLTLDGHGSPSECTINKYNGANKLNPDWERIFELYGETAIIKSTSVIIKRGADDRERKHIEGKLTYEREQQFILTEAKYKIYDNPLFKKIKSIKNKRRLRKARNDFEVLIYAAALFGDVLYNEHKSD